MLMNSKLKALWDEKLKTSGFIDIENSDGSLKPGVHAWTRKKAEADKDNREMYYRIAAEFLHTYTFKSSVARRIWEAHANGKSIRHIAHSLKLKTYLVHRTVTQLKQLLKVLYENRSK